MLWAGRGEHFAPLGAWGLGWEAHQSPPPGLVVSGALKCPLSRGYWPGSGPKNRGALSRKNLSPAFVNSGLLESTPMLGKSLFILILVFYSIYIISISILFYVVFLYYYFLFYDILLLF